jgi:hypothetical protein
MPPAAVAYKVVRRYTCRAKGAWSPGWLGECDRVGYLPELAGSSNYAPRELGQGWALRDDAGSTLFTAANNSLGGMAAYPPGVHAFKFAKDAFAVALSQVIYGSPISAVVKVYLRGPIVEGRQYGVPVLVYREMTLVEALSRHPWRRPRAEELR